MTLKRTPLSAKPKFFSREIRLQERLSLIELHLHSLNEQIEKDPYITLGGTALLILIRKWLDAFRILNLSWIHLLHFPLRLARNDVLHHSASLSWCHSYMAYMLMSDKSDLTFHGLAQLMII